MLFWAPTTTPWGGGGGTELVPGRRWAGLAWHQLHPHPGGGARDKKPFNSLHAAVQRCFHRGRGSASSPNLLFIHSTYTYGVPGTHQILFPAMGI